MNFSFHLSSPLSLKNLFYKSRPCIERLLINKGLKKLADKIDLAKLIKNARSQFDEKDKFNKEVFDNIEIRLSNALSKLKLRMLGHSIEEKQAVGILIINNNFPCLKDLHSAFAQITLLMTIMQKFHLPADKVKEHCNLKLKEILEHCSRLYGANSQAVTKLRVIFPGIQ